MFDSDVLFLGLLPKLYVSEGNLGSLASRVNFEMASAITWRAYLSSHFTSKVTLYEAIFCDPKWKGMKWGFVVFIDLRHGDIFRHLVTSMALMHLAYARASSRAIEIRTILELLRIYIYNNPCCLYEGGSFQYKLWDDVVANWLIIIHELQCSNSTWAARIDSQLLVPRPFPVFDCDKQFRFNLKMGINGQTALVVCGLSCVCRNIS